MDSLKQPSARGERSTSARVCSFFSMFGSHGFVYNITNIKFVFGV